MAGGVRIGRGTVLAPNEEIAQHTTPLLAEDAVIPDKTDFQKAFEKGDPRIIAAMMANTIVNARNHTRTMNNEFNKPSKGFPTESTAKPEELELEHALHQAKKKEESPRCCSKQSYRQTSRCRGSFSPESKEEKG
ncbi:hypothetical protein Tco_0801650 [Tanacetum coccineum]|uniref:Uncharacterized protein n=1 Tax=Tanacetum coccineum TaxID=301880 RepID=A0ABQ4ZXE3_9ASTR